jgi:hypothetical protein
MIGYDGTAPFPGIGSRPFTTRRHDRATNLWPLASRRRRLSHDQSQQVLQPGGR